VIGAQQVVDLALAEAGRLGKADETVVLVTDRADAALRWAGNSMTTNSESVSRHTTVIAIVRRGNTAHVGSVRSSDVDPAVIADLVGASQQTALAAPEARDTAPPLPGTYVPADWDAPVTGTGAQVFSGLTDGLAQGFRGADAVRVCPAHRGDHVRGHVDRTEAAVHTADRLGGDQRQARRCQREGRCQHAQLR